MARAIWEGAVLAESDEGVIVEGNYYFPVESLNHQHFEKSTATSICPWKGTAHYYDVAVDGKRNPDAAWYYPDPKPAAEEIGGKVAFWRGVIVER
ncbi:MAG: DUF427 domain-containing protein [Acidobacteria bacterium]|nr:DUF427 domain-containing protein [Acidobacteriota bacterium]MDA1233980.1 DUF427 domain-containing protein [Acidobacteriota bacterium]